jgi:hypothetical protein
MEKNMRLIRLHLAGDKRIITLNIDRIVTIMEGDEGELGAYTEVDTTDTTIQTVESREQIESLIEETLYKEVVLLRS